MRRLRRILLGLSVVCVAAFAALAGSSWYYGGSDGMGCARCHEIRPMVDAWSRSTHRGVTCKECHGSSLSADVRMHVKNLTRVWLHSRGETPEQIRLRHGDVAPLLARCRTCHAQEYAEWKGGPHGVTYATLFLDETHNRGQQLIDDCLRCHGMHFDGGIADLVAPIDREGPWRLVAAAMADEPAIPCMACHTVHREGQPLGPRVRRPAVPGVAQQVVKPSLALYDRRSLEHVPLGLLPLPAMQHRGSAVKTSPDQRQALCYQCHAPRPEMQVFSGDDRTPAGVHEGLSCQACHARHRQTTRASCAACHPRLSNCGLDVETMDTTFRKTDSTHDVHTVACADCHPKGVPRGKAPAPVPQPVRLPTG
jgi:hypothetical protein